MATGSALRELATFVEACESGEGAVTGVCLAECVDPSSDDPLRAEVELTLSSADSTGGEGALSVCGRVDADGRLRLALESCGSVVPTDGHDVAVDPVETTVDADGTVTVTLSAVVPMAGSGASTGDDGPVAAVTASGSDAGRGRGRDGVSGGGPSGDERDVPPFRDRDLLADIYESEDTFADMAEALEMDVTAETVRRYMIDYDIHQPDSYDTGEATDDSGESGDGGDGTDGRRERERDATTPAVTADGGGTDGSAADGAGTDGTAADGAETDGTAADGADTDYDAVAPEADGTAAAEASPVVISDGIGLPDDVTVDTLIESVKRSNTIYEVTQDVDMGRHEALDMLQDLNLLDLVVGRLATETDRNITREDVVARLREASATQ